MGLDPEIMLGPRWGGRGAGGVGLLESCNQDMFLFLFLFFTEVHCIGSNASEVVLESNFWFQDGHVSE